FDLMAAVTLETLAQQAESAVISLDDVTGRVFGRRELDADEARVVSRCGRLRMAGIDGAYGAYGTDGHVIALMAETDGAARPLVVLRPAR
ncbi:MAG: tRNA pseudouridine(55) synthase TruB, partial [Mycobacteriales bacterium]